MTLDNTPRIEKIVWLKQLSKPFPKTADNILHVAKIWDFDKNTVDFLKLFPKSMLFKNEEEFLQKCDKLQHFVKYASIELVGN